MQIDDDKKNNNCRLRENAFTNDGPTKGLKLRSNAIGQMVDGKPDVILVDERWKENLKARCATIKEMYWHKIE